MQERELTHQQVADRTGYARVSVTRALGGERVSERFWRRFSAAFPAAAEELVEEPATVQRG
jgi:hypothetical protein